ncbi:MAG: CHAT domain-containing protein, partial [Saprospiraceae bacterium]
TSQNVISPSPAESENTNSEVTKILFLAANPKNTSRLRIGEEFREIEEKIRLSKFRDQFQFTTKWAVRVPDIMQALLDVEPNIIHFAGHGEEDGIQVEDVNGFPQTIPKEALALLFSEFSESIRCVVLNACLSEEQGHEIAKNISYVVGTNKEIGDKSSIAFSVGFYQALGAKKEFDQAFRLGQIAIALQGLSGKDIPVLIKKED